jgi:hypothetical protein
MRLLQQVKLPHSSPKKLLYIKYPDDFQGEKSESDADEYFSLGTEFRLLTEDELDLVYKELGTDRENAASKVVFSGCVQVDPEDPLRTYSSEDLDELEKELGYPSTRRALNGGINPVDMRVIEIRTRGYRGNGLERLQEKVPAGF